MRVKTGGLDRRKLFPETQLIKTVFRRRRGNSSVPSFLETLLLRFVEIEMQRMVMIKTVPPARKPWPSSRACLLSAWSGLRTPAGDVFPIEEFARAAVGEANLVAAAFRDGLVPDDRDAVGQASARRIEKHGALVRAF
jgi:hypothetical protein